MNRIGFWCLTALALVLSLQQPAHGQTYYCAGYTVSMTVSVSRSTDYNVHAVSQIQAGPCQSWTKTILRSPNGSRTNQAVSCDYNGYPCYGASLVSADAILPMGTEDGLYTATGSFKTEDESTNPWTYADYPDKTGQAYIGGYVQLTGVTWNPTSISKTGTAQFTVNLLASNSCGGSVSVQDALSAIPPGLLFQWNGSGQTVTIANGATLGGLTTSISVTLSLPGNSATGSLQATGYLYSLPAGCSPRDPPAPALRTATLTITN